MGVDEPHAVAGEAVEVWGWDLGLGVVAAQVAVAQVVGKNDDDVGAKRLIGRLGRGQGTRAGRGENRP
ncbi:MAG: hypothetical protein ACYC35_24035 [Pirellulales bacterium]